MRDIRRRANASPFRFRQETLGSSPRLWGAAVTVLLTLLPAPLRAQFFAPKNVEDVILEHRVVSAIDRGVESLLKGFDSRIEEGDVGELALQVYAMLVAGVAENGPLIRSAFARLEKTELQQSNYGRSVMVLALDAAISQLEYDARIAMTPEQRKKGLGAHIGREYRAQMRSLAKKLLSMQLKDGGWRYGASDTQSDNSCSQFVVLALGACARRGIKIPAQVWVDTGVYFLSGQALEGPLTPKRLELHRNGEGDRNGITVRGIDGDESSSTPEEKQAGVSAKRSPKDPVIGTETVPVFARGWGYFPQRDTTGGSTWNMTCAGLSSLLLAHEYSGVEFPAELVELMHAGIRDGYGWLMHHWRTVADYYGLYSLEKVADLGRVRTLDGRDWYRQHALYLLAEQRADGSWNSRRGDRVSTSFALLFLGRATSILLGRPVEMVYTGTKDETEKHSDAVARRWVFLPDLERWIYYPKIVRVIRWRPQPQLVDLLGQIVRNYPAAYAPELIPELLRGAERVTSDTVAELLRAHVDEITGGIPRSGVEEWIEIWRGYLAVGRERRVEEAPRLIADYPRHRRSVPMRVTILWALSRCRVVTASALLLDELEQDDERLRRAAYSGLWTIYPGKLPAFSAADPKRKRQSVVEEIRRIVAELSPDENY